MPLDVSNGTIDITDLVEASRQTFVTWAVAYLYGEEIAIPGFEWVALPVISDLDRAALRSIVNALSNSAIMLAFFENTAIRKADQAQNFINAVNNKLNLPSTATDAEYEQAEKAQVTAFANFVRVSN